MYGYGNSMFLATHAILARPSGGIDPDAQAFITAAAITDPTQQSAINQLVVDLKGYNIWTKFKAIYPIVGGTAAQHKWNLKDPRDLDAAFRLTYGNGYTHSSTGMLPNGSSAYADTKFIANNHLTVSSGHISIYSRTNVEESSCDFGGSKIPSVFAIEAPEQVILTRFPSLGFVAVYGSYNSNLQIANADSRGHFITNRNSLTNTTAFKNGVKIIDAAATSGLSTSQLVISAESAATPTITRYSTREIAFASIGDGLTDTDAANYYTAVQAYQTTLGREMIENQQLELDAGNTNSYPGTGTTWTDLSGNSRNGTLTGGVGYSSLNGGYLTFNGTNQYINVANTTSVLSNVNKFSLNTWFKLNNAALNNTIFSFGTASNFANDILVGVYGNTFLAQVNNGGDGSATIGFTSTAWTNIQLVYDGTLTGNANRLKIYINGVLQTLTYSYTVPSTTGTTSQCGIGVYSTPGFNSNFLNGDVSVTELYSSALDQTQVTQNFNSIKSRYGL